MFANYNWWSESRKKLVRIGINGGGVCYDNVTGGFKKIPEQKRLSVINALCKFDAELERIFLDDGNIEEEKFERS
ncbi:MAG: hypothetical protein WC196_06275 [Bacilli bacterium]|jgi:hypothetical protein